MKAVSIWEQPTCLEMAETREDGGRGRRKDGGAGLRPSHWMHPGTPTPAAWFLCAESHITCLLNSSKVLEPGQKQGLIYFKLRDIN